MKTNYKKSSILRLRLAENDLTLKWLKNRLEEYGMSISVSTLSLILNNNYSNKEMNDAAITIAEKILDRYEEAMKPTVK